MVGLKSSLTLSLRLLAAAILILGEVNAGEYCTHDEHGQAVCQVLSDSDESLVTIAAETSSEDVIIDVKVPHLQLTTSINFNRLRSLAIKGDPTVINCTSSDNDTGITFTKIMNLTLNNLTLTSCGSKFTIRQRTYTSALIVRSCGDLNFTHLKISNSHGIGLTILNHEKGQIHIARTNLTDNKISYDEKDIYGGGGVYIGEFQPNSSSPVSFVFQHCTFDKNIARTRHYHQYYTDEYGDSRTGYGQGGGVFIALENDIIHSFVNVSFSHCIFTENQGFLGGGLSVKIGKGRSQITITNIIVTLDNSVFEMNGCNITTSKQGTTTRIGGGAHLSYYAVKSPRGEYNVRNVNFTGNCAEFGGGVHFISYWHKPSNYSIDFSNCTFKSNRAHTGSAVDLTPRDFIKLTDGQLPVPTFTNCTFLYNAVSYNSNSRNTQRATGIGTLYSSLYNVRFEGENRFESNSGTAVYTVNGVADFSRSSANFTRNTGIRGGAIALLGSSSMVVGPGKKYAFLGNTAHYQGGAIFVHMINTHDFTLSRTCFLQYFDGNDFRITKNWNNNITFDENDAQVGRAIFATSLHPCQAINQGNESHPIFTVVNASDVFEFRGININVTDIATAGAQLQYTESTLNTIPGKQYDHGVRVMDDTGSEVEEPLRTNLFTRKTENTTVELDSAFSLYVGQKIQFNGKPGDHVELLLQTVSPRLSYATFNVKLEECPPGFKLDDDNKCICNSNEHYGLLGCKSNGFNAYLTPGLWAGLITDKERNETELVTYVCPLHYCEYNCTCTRGVVLPQTSDDLEMLMCGKKRKGVLCGTCREGYTVHFHSPDYQCKNASDTLCKVGWLFYVISELVPVTVVFITVIVFNISFTSGAVNGFILFSQILLSLNIDASGVIRFPNKKEVTEGYQFLYGFLNLDFFTIDTMSFCLWPNATALDMLAFKYITIVYALSLVILVIWLMNKFGGRCFGKLCRITTVKSSIIHGISAFFIICYSQTIKVSYSLINGGILWRKEGSNMSTTKRIWFNGDIVYFSHEHLPYALPALFCLLTIGTIPPLLLLINPLFNKILSFLCIENSKPVIFISQKLPVNSLKPLIDCFQGCFKDNLRFFSGLYFLYRWIIPIVYSTSSGLGTAYIVTEVCLIFMLAIHAFFQPYQQRVHNAVDTLLFINLLFINSITSINYVLFQSQESRITVEETVARTATFQMFLIYMPLFLMCSYLLVITSKQIFRILSKNRGSQEHINHEIDLTATKTMQRLRAALRPIIPVSDDICDNELPHRLIADDVSYQNFEDVDHFQETYAESKPKTNSDTY